MLISGICKCLASYGLNALLRYKGLVDDLPLAIEFEQGEEVNKDAVVVEHDLSDLVVSDLECQDLALARLGLAAHPAGDGVCDWLHLHSAVTVRTLQLGADVKSTLQACAVFFINPLEIVKCGSLNGGNQFRGC